MVSFIEAWLFSAREGEAKFWITLYFENMVSFDLDYKYFEVISNFVTIKIPSRFFLFR